MNESADDAVEWVTLLNEAESLFERVRQAEKNLVLMRFWCSYMHPNLGVTWLNS